MRPLKKGKLICVIDKGLKIELLATKLVVEKTRLKTITVERIVKVEVARGNVLAYKLERNTRKFNLID